MMTEIDHVINSIMRSINPHDVGSVNSDSVEELSTLVKAGVTFNDDTREHLNLISYLLKPMNTVGDDDSVKPVVYDNNGDQYGRSSFDPEGWKKLSDVVDLLLGTMAIEETQDRGVREITSGDETKNKRIEKLAVIGIFNKPEEQKEEVEDDVIGLACLQTFRNG